MSRELRPALDADTGVPLHRQVYDTVRSAILRGDLLPGERLPATRSLSQQLNVARATVAEAYAQLRLEGYVQARQGSGTYVASALPGPAPTPTLPTSERPALSAWAQRVMDEADVHSASPDVEFDFRPGQIASDLFPWDAWRTSVDRALSEDRDDLVPYPPPAGHAGLRRLICAHVGEYRNVHCSPEQVVIVNGTQQALNLLVQILTVPGERVGMEDPGFPSARRLFHAHGLAITAVPVDADGMQVEEFSGLPPHRLLLTTPTHQLPTGVTMSLSRRMALLDLAAHTGAYVVEDDYDSEFRYEGRPVESLQGLDRHGAVIYAGTFSKSLLSGLRLGFLVVPPALVRPLTEARAAWDGGTGMMEQAALAQFLASGGYERHIRRMRRLYHRRRDALVFALQQHFGPAVSMRGGHGGLQLLVELDVPLSGEEVLLGARAAGVLLRSAAEYYRNPPTRPHFLMGFAGMPEENIARGVACLAGAVGTIGPAPAAGNTLIGMSVVR